jgi:hypothetical protein
MEISHILIVVTKIYDYPDDIDHIDDDNDNPQYAHDYGHPAFMPSMG